MSSTTSRPNHRRRSNGSEDLRVLVVGSGGREHALCWKLRDSSRCDDLFCAPGNPGIAELAELVPIPASGTDALADWARESAIDLAVIGPDDPLASGIVDALAARGIRAFGPTRAAAEIEWSKIWAKHFCVEHDIPTARFATFSDVSEAHRYVDQAEGGVVVKADGLALGKGVFVCPERAEAHRAIDRLMQEEALGDAGRRIVVEELMVGRELSAFAVCDGTTYRLLPLARDHKAAFDGDHGPNTGGMGAYSPVDWATADMVREIELRIIAPAVRGLRNAGRPFVGFLFAGVMWTAAGARLIEFNARLGDPEAQVILPRLDLDLLDLFDLAVDGRLSQAPVDTPVLPDAYCCVVLASGGYPGSYRTGLPLDGLEAVEDGVLAFHAGTRFEAGRLVSAGGRVVGISAPGATLAEARARAYANVGHVRLENAHYRRDIGAR